MCQEAKAEKYEVMAQLIPGQQRNGRFGWVEVMVMEVVVEWLVSTRTPSINHQVTCDSLYGIISVSWVTVLGRRSVGLVKMLILEVRGDN